MIKSVVDLTTYPKWEGPKPPSSMTRAEHAIIQLLETLLLLDERAPFSTQRDRRGQDMFKELEFRAERDGIRIIPDSRPSRIRVEDYLREVLDVPFGYPLGNPGLGLLLEHKTLADLKFRAKVAAVVGEALGVAREDGISRYRGNTSRGRGPSVR